GPQRNGINLRSRQKCKNAAAEHGEEVGPVGGTQDLLPIAEVDVARGDADEDFDQGDGDADTNGNEAGDKRQTNPNRRDEPDIVHSEWPLRISPEPPFPGRRGTHSLALFPG